MAILGTTRLKVANGSAAVTKLWNDRYRLEFLCDTTSKAHDWYYDNIGGILPDFTASQEDFFGTGVNEGWQAIPESVYPNMVCVEASYDYIPSIGEKRVSLAYETLSSEWVQEKDDTVTYSENGLKRVSRVSVALPDTAYTSVVGTTTIDSGGVTLYLASREIDETDAKWTLKEVWYEAGVLKESTSGVSDGLVKKSITYLKIEPSAPANHIIVSRDIGNFEGLETIIVTYMILPVEGTPPDDTNTHTYKTTQQFTVPGIVDWEKYTAGLDIDNYMLKITPPVKTSVDAVVVAEYTTDGASDLTGYYQPNFWTGVVIVGNGYNNQPFGSSSTYMNHIAANDGVDVYESADPHVGFQAIQSKRIYAGTTGQIQITGPETDVAGTSLVIEKSRTEMFTDIDGNVYYKYLTVTADIPARPTPPTP